MSTSHASLTGSDLHEPKGIGSASNNQVYVANGAGSGTWKTLNAANAVTDLTATATELNNECDISAREISAGATLTLSATTHGGKTVLLNSTGGSVVTLPASSGSGARFLLKVSVLATSNSHKVQVANSSDVIQGLIMTVDTDTSGTVTGWASASDSDTISLNRTTTGSVTRGEWIELEDVASNLWLVRGVLSNTGSGATPFSSAV